MCMTKQTEDKSVKRDYTMQNDLSFVIDSRLSLYEHQSTYNPNLPLRFLLYLSDLHEKMITGKNVYGCCRKSDGPFLLYPLSVSIDTTISMI